MARQKPIDTNPRLQLHSGTFEHAVDDLLEHAIDPLGFDARFRSDTTGATTCPRAVVLKMALGGNARGIVRSRPIARAASVAPTSSLSRRGWRRPRRPWSAAIAQSVRSPIPPQARSGAEPRIPPARS